MLCQCPPDVIHCKKKMNEKVLFINNVRSLLLISELLSRLGYDVDLASNAGEALEHLERQEYDIIIDLESPDAESWITCEKIRERTAAPLIVISLNASIQTCVKAINAGADYFLRKSFGPRELLTRMNSLLMRDTFRRSFAGDSRQVEIMKAAGADSAVQESSLPELGTGNQTKIARRRQPAVKSASKV